MPNSVQGADFMKKTLESTIREYIHSDPARFHMPGHKGSLCGYDVTELDFSDNLQKPEGVIADLQHKCADVYGAKQAFLLVNGSSSGVCAFMLALAMKLHRSPRILAARDCHKSFLSGAFFSNALVAGVYPENEKYGTVTAARIEKVLKGIDTKPDAIYITSPNYYGMCADTESIARLAHDNGMYLFVDAAHGAHFPFDETLPKVSSYADAWVVSTHKTLAALNQTGLLMCNCDMAFEMQASLNMLQTTSPSYPLMISTESAMDNGYRYKKHICRIIAFRKRLAGAGISLAKKPASANEFDVARLCIEARGIAETGYKLAERLASCGIYVEMADLDCVVCITTPDDKDEWYNKLYDALTSMKSCLQESKDNYRVEYPHEQGVEYISVRDAYLSDTESVQFCDAAGRTAADSLGVYPPGISTVFPGEIITDHTVRQLEENERSGGKLFGVTNGAVRVKR